jgi:HAD superfamily hydrolase (TIGR01509 family)
MTLVIFDCDGVLVDSEAESNRILAEQLTAWGHPVDAETSIARYTGMSMKSLVAAVERETGRQLSDDFVQSYRAEVTRAFDESLQPIAGVAEVLAAHDGLRCVASSSMPFRIERSLRTTGLIDYFRLDALFSAAMVERGKPAPDLFLHAAERMGIPPSDCIVIEDSVYGVEAAVAAGMPALGFTGGGHIRDGHDARLRDRGATEVFDDMALLPDLLARYLP